MCVDTSKRQSVSFLRAFLVVLVVIFAVIFLYHLGVGLYRGLFAGGFILANGSPITSAQGYRYWLIVLGEGFGIGTIVASMGLVVSNSFVNRNH